MQPKCSFFKGKMKAQREASTGDVGQVFGPGAGKAGWGLAFRLWLGSACLVSKKVGMVDGHGCGLFQENRLSSDGQLGGVGLLEWLRSVPFCEGILRTSHCKCEAL